MLALTVNPETVTAFAAFFSGIGTVVTGALALRWERKRSRQDCEDRIKALREGIELAKQIQENSRDAA